MTTMTTTTTQATVRDILIAARARIADPERWTQGAFARDGDGARTEQDTDRAQSWCAIGTLTAETQDIVHGWALWSAAYEVLKTTCADLYFKRITYVNDILGHAAVLAAYDEAIRRTGQQENSRVASR